MKVCSHPVDLIQALQDWSPQFERIGLEAGPLSQWLYEGLAAAGLPVICIETRHAKAFMKAQPNKTDRNDARGIAQMMRVNLYRPVHVKTLRSQKYRILLTARKLLQEKAIAIENDIRGLLRNFGLKVGTVGRLKFEERIRELVDGISDIAEIMDHLLAKFCCKLFVKLTALRNWLSMSRDVLMFKGRHFDKSVILLCVRWYLAYNLSLRNLKEMMAERGVEIDHSTVHRWVVHFSPRLLERFNRRKRQVTRKWNLDETYVKVKGEWMYLYRAIDSNGDTVEFCFSKDRDLATAKRFIRKALARHGRPERITIDGSQTNRMAIAQCDAESRLQQAGKLITIRSSKYMNNSIEQDHRRVKRRIRSMLGFKSEIAASITLAGIELIHMMRKQQGIFASTKAISLKAQFAALTV